MFLFVEVLLVRTGPDVTSNPLFSFWKDNEYEIFYLAVLYRYSSVIIAHYCNNKRPFFYTMWVFYERSWETIKDTQQK